MTHWSPAMLSTIPTKATGIAFTFALLAAGVAVAVAVPQALRTSVAMVRTKLRIRKFFMICLSLYDLLNLIVPILAQRIFCHNLHWSQFRAPEVEDCLRL
jgi:hypothetical protein